MEERNDIVIYKSEDKVLYYNLDAIISVGYRINSLRATKFRIWSTSIIKEYMRRGYVVNHNAVSEQKYEDLKKAVGLLENVFSKELLLTSGQARWQPTKYPEIFFNTSPRRK